MYYHSLSVSVAVVFTLVFATVLAETAPADWTYGKRLLLALFYLFWARCIKKLVFIVTDLGSLCGPRALIL
jgi:hypothetical protein